LDYVADAGLRGVNTEYRKLIIRAINFEVSSGVGTKSRLRGPGEAWAGDMVLGGLGSAVSSPNGIRGEAPAAKSFGAFWVLQMSSPAVLLLYRGVIHSGFCGVNYCGSKRYFRPRGFSIAVASAAVAPAVPTPLEVTQPMRPCYNVTDTRTEDSRSQYRALPFERRAVKTVG